MFTSLISFVLIIQQIPINALLNITFPIRVGEICQKNLIKSIFTNSSNLLYLTDNYCNTNLIIEDAPHLILSTSGIYRTFRKQYNYILCTDNYDTLIQQIDKLRSSNVWDGRFGPQRKFLIFVSSDEDIDDIFDYLKRIFVIRVIVVKMNEGFTFTIYKNVNICNEVSYEIIYGDCSNGIAVIDFLVTQDDLKGCTLRVVALPFVLHKNYAGYAQNGTIGLLIRPVLLLKRLYNLNVTIIIPNEAKQAEYITSSEMKIIENGDLVVVAPYRHFDIMKYLHFSNTVYYENIYWLVRKPRQFTNPETLIYIFKFRIWTCYCASFIIGVILDQYFEKLHAPNNKPTITKSILFYTKIAFGNSVKFPKYFVKRLFLITYLFLSTNIFLMFQSKLNAVLTVPYYVKPINNVETLFQTSYKLMMSNLSRNLYGQVRHPLAKKIVERAQLVPKDYKNLSDAEIVLTHKNIAVVSRRLKSSYAEFIRVHKFVDDVGFKMDMSYALQNGSYYLPYVNNVIKIVRESGLFAKWVNDIAYNATPSASVKIIALNITHFYGAFGCLIIGIVVSMVVFFGEIMLYKHTKFQKKKNRA